MVMISSYAVLEDRSAGSSESKSEKCTHDGGHLSAVDGGPILAATDVVSCRRSVFGLARSSEYEVLKGG